MPGVINRQGTIGTKHTRDIGVGDMAMVALAVAQCRELSQYIPTNDIGGMLPSVVSNQLAEIEVVELLVTGI